MNQALPSTIESKNRLWAAIGGPIGLWSSLRKGGVELSWVLGGRFTSMGANAALMLFLAERLHLPTYGLFVITISCQLLISRLLLLGVEVGTIRLIAVPDLRSREREVVSAGLVIIASTSVVLIAIALLSVPILSRFDIPGWIIACIVFGSIGTALVDYGYGFRLAHEQYPLAALAQGGTALFRLGITGIAVVSFTAHPFALLLSYHGASLCSGLLQTLIIAVRNWHRPDKSLKRRLLRYSLWLGQANVIVIFALYQGTFLLMLLKQPEETGIFGLALTLSLGFFAVYNAYGDYLLPRIRSVEHVSDIPAFVRRSFITGILLILACAPVVIALAKLLPWFLGPQWLEVAPVFVNLAASMLLLIIQAPLEAACHYVLKPYLVTFGWLVRAILTGLGALIFASTSMHATWVAMGQLLGAALALMVLCYVVSRVLRSAIKAES